MLRRHSGSWRRQVLLPPSLLLLLPKLCPLTRNLRALAFCLTPRLLSLFINVAALAISLSLELCLGVLG